MSKTKRKNFVHDESLYTDHAKQLRKKERHEKRIRNALRSKNIEELWRIEEDDYDEFMGNLY